MVAAVFCASLAEAQVHGGSTPVATTAAHAPQPAGTRANLNQRQLQSGVHHPHRHPFPVGGVIYALPYPLYLTDPGEDGSGVDAATGPPQPDPGNYGPGPTIFDNNGANNTASAYESDGPARPPAASTAGYGQNMSPAAPLTDPRPHTTVDRAPDTAPAADQLQTILVFKDGHLLEVQNYAIVGDMLYDVTAGHRSKIALADLDLSATAKENDDRGIDFQLPNRPATN